MLIILTLYTHIWSYFETNVFESPPTSLDSNVRTSFKINCPKINVANWKESFAHFKSKFLKTIGIETKRVFLGEIINHLRDNC